MDMDILSHKSFLSGIRRNVETRALLDIVELVAVIICIPISYHFSLFLSRNFDFFFYNREFKIFLFQNFNYYNFNWHFNPLQFAFFSGLIIISWYVLSQLTIMAKMPRTQRYGIIIIHFIRGNFFIFVILMGFKFVLNLTAIPVIFIATYVLVSMLVTLAIRLIATRKVQIYRASGHNLRHIMVIADDGFMKIIEDLLRHKEWGYKINSIVTRSEKVAARFGNDVAVYPGIDEVKHALESSVIDEVLYCKKNNDESEIRSLVELCDEVGVMFRIQSCTSTVDPMQLSLKTINHNGKLVLADIPSFNLPVEIKTITDIYLSVIAVILLSPLFLLLAILIKLDSRGPVFFKQERVGLRGRKFMLYKFRTMVVNAEELLENLKANNETDGPAFKMKDDPRVTRVGRFLRKTGLDEFPQLFNVIGGEMSLIGPRPPLESEVKQYQRWHIRRLSVKPGITCTWQIKPDRNDIKFDKWMLMDLNYIDNWSLLLDLKLFFQTIKTLFVAGGR